MNNLAFGGLNPVNGREFTYYETMGGGMGGGPGHPGLDGMHGHMTNTRNTPVEVLEHDYPVLMERYAFREHSGARAVPGGPGAHPGFLFSDAGQHQPPQRAAGTCSLRPPGGGPGTPGENVLITEKGEERLPGKINLTLPAGSRLSIRTPGGGGWEESKNLNPWPSPLKILDIPGLEVIFFLRSFKSGKRS